ncbi:MAG TPA: hemolysin family protein [Brumimicrobium sp.]|nr:hemolysin family protein [Brumimicrobium sp.]
MYSIIFLSLLLSAFFSGMEIAYISSNKIFVEIEKKQETILAAVLKKITKRPSKFIATMLVGNTIALVVYGFYMGDLLTGLLPVDGALGLLVHTVISTVVILMTAEFFPKVFFQIYANNLLKILAIPAYFFYILFSLISEFVIWISDGVMKLFFKTQGDSFQLSFSKLELNNYISEQLEAMNDDDDLDSEIQIFQNALEFSDVKARDVMIPRTEIVAVDVNTSPKDVAKLFTESGFSKLLVFKESIDNIIGYIHAFELFKRPKTIKEILIPVMFVPETVLVKDALNMLIKKRKSITIVIDEYGGTAGMMTVEDIIEELFGEIEDEHDVDELTEIQLSPTSFQFSSRLEVEYINETYKLNLPESDNYETLGGMIVHFTQEIPEKDEVVQMENFRFKILEVSNTKIELVALEIVEAE